MKKCKWNFGTDECLKNVENRRCLDSCDYLKGLSQDDLIDVVVNFLLDDSDILRAKTDELIREKVIKKAITFVNRIVESTLKSIGNPRLDMEKEDIKAEMHIAINISIDKFDMTKASFKTFMTWIVRGKLSNLLRMCLSQKRSINYYNVVGSLQDNADEDEKGGAYEDFIGTEDLGFNEIEREQFIAELSEEEQQVLRLMINGHDLKDIFKLLNISTIEVYSILASITIKSQEFNDE